MGYLKFQKILGRILKNGRFLAKKSHLAHFLRRQNIFSTEIISMPPKMPRFG